MSSDFLLFLEIISNFFNFLIYPWFKIFSKWLKTTFCLSHSFKPHTISFIIYVFNTKFYFLIIIINFNNLCINIITNIYKIIYIFNIAIRYL